MLSSLAVGLKATVFFVIVWVVTRLIRNETLPPGRASANVT
jgi:hypothetical protein